MTHPIEFLMADYILPPGSIPIHPAVFLFQNSIFRHKGKVGTKGSTVGRVSTAHLPQGFKFLKKFFFHRYLLIVGCDPTSRNFLLSLRTQKIASWVRPFRCLVTLTLKGHYFSWMRNEKYPQDVKVSGTSGQTLRSFNFLKTKLFVILLIYQTSKCPHSALWL